MWGHVKWHEGLYEKVLEEEDKGNSDDITEKQKMLRKWKYLEDGILNHWHGFVKHGKYSACLVSSFNRVSRLLSKKVQ